jgi:hypothetical protein
MPTPRPRALLQEKALVRAVARGRGGFPGEVRQCSGKRSGQSIRPLRGTSKGAIQRRGLSIAKSHPTPDRRLHCGAYLAKDWTSSSGVTQPKAVRLWYVARDARGRNRPGAWVEPLAESARPSRTRGGRYRSRCRSVVDRLSPRRDPIQPEWVTGDLPCSGPPYERAYGCFCATRENRAKRVTKTATSPGCSEVVPVSY